MELIQIYDFGSQYTQLIARRIRELNVYCEIIPFQKFPQVNENVKGIILSGSPFSVLDENAPTINFSELKHKIPIMGVCYGAQLYSHLHGGKVSKAVAREYGRAHLTDIKENI